jgi:lipase maturation factor 1|uniref:lipase maturation factor family protein n=1 Tax=Cephaloticoccus sp. TaxID=1985742 RepID=UPI00404B88EF
MTRGNPLTWPWFRPFARRGRDFAGFGDDATYLWPRWLVLRAVGLVFIVVFAGILTDVAGLIGPDGVVPLPEAMEQIRALFPNQVEAFLRNPSLFWLSDHAVMPVLVGWLGLFAAFALVGNFWPRMMLFICWVSLLSFVKGWLLFSGPLVDGLILEVALLSIPFAPAGYRPGLGADSAPRPLVVFMMRWLLFRVMFESGISKLLSQDLYWYNFTAMDVLYETAPNPTILGYLDHQLPHLWHIFEIVLTFTAEIAAPLIAVFGGRRGRWFALGAWTLLQLGIQLTCNFGWLNFASIGLGLMLLDDQMIAESARGLRLRSLANFLQASAVKLRPPPLGRFRRYGLYTALWIHFYLSVTVFTTLAGPPSNRVLDSVSRPLSFAFGGLGSCNAYTLYSRLDPFHFVAEFLGSNDGGVTWHPYEFRHFPQALDRIGAFSAPWFHRFEANLQVQASANDQAPPIYGLVATRLLEQKQPVLGFFASNPFPDRPPQMIRVAGYRYTFTDYATYRATGNFWERTYLGEYQPMTFIGPTGNIAQVTSSLEQLQVFAHYGNPLAQTKLGILFINGEEGVQRDPALAAKWFRRAGEQRQTVAQLNLGLMLAQGDGIPRDETEAFVWFTVAAHSGHPAAAQERDRLKWRLDAHIVSAAEERAAGIISELEAGPASSTAP